MKVSELIKALGDMPASAEVSILYDGAFRLPAEIAWLSNSGNVGIGTKGEVVYYDTDRPLNAPSQHEDPFFKLPV